MTVYVVQNPTLYDPKTGRKFYKYREIPKAKAFGELVYLLHPYRLPPTYEAIENELEMKLADVDEFDYLLPVGESVSRLLAALIFSRNTGGPVPILKFDNIHRNYYEHVWVPA